MDSPSPTENGSAQGSHPFSIRPSNSPSFFQGAPVQPCFQQCRSAEPGAWCSFPAAEGTGSVVTTVVSAQTKAAPSALTQISCLLKRQLSEHLLTQSSQHKGGSQVVFPIIKSHINTGEAWTWHLRIESRIYSFFHNTEKGWNSLETRNQSGMRCY